MSRQKSNVYQMLSFSWGLCFMFPCISSEDFTENSNDKALHIQSTNLYSHQDISKEDQSHDVFSLQPKVIELSEETHTSSFSSSYKTLKEKYDELTSKVSQKKAEQLYEDYINPPKPKRKKRDRRQLEKRTQDAQDTLRNKLKESARLGYIPARLILLKEELKQLEEEKSLLDQRLGEMNEKLGEEKKTYSIVEANNIYRNSFELEFNGIHEINHKILHLEDCLKDHQVFHYDIDFFQENDLMLLFFNFDEEPSSPTCKSSPEISLSVLEKNLFRHLDHINYLKNYQNRLQDRIKNLSKEAKCLEGEAFIIKIQKVFNDSGQTIDQRISEIEEIFLNIKDRISFLEETDQDNIKKLNDLLNYLEGEIHDVEKEYDSVSTKMFSIIEGYTSKTYTTSLRVWSHLNKLKEEILSIMCSFPQGYNPDYDETALYQMVRCFIESHDQILDDKQSRKESRCTNCNGNEVK